MKPIFFASSCFLCFGLIAGRLVLVNEKSAPMKQASHDLGYESLSDHGPKGALFMASFVDDTPLKRTRTSVECDVIPEIVLVQDISGSYNDDIENMRRVVPELLGFLKERFNGTAKFGIVSFVDKYVPGTTWASSHDDFCAHLNLPLTPVDSPTVADSVTEVFSSLLVGGGGDYLDGGNEAMFRALLSPQVGWSTGTRDPDTGRAYLRLVVLATDAAVHEAGFHQQQARVRLATNPVLDKPAAYLRNSINGYCDVMDYPSFAQLRDALELRKATAVVLAGDPVIWTSGRPHLPDQYRKDWIARHPQLSTENRWDDEVDGLSNFYASYFRDFIGVDSIVERLDNSSSNFMSAFYRAINDATEHACSMGFEENNSTTSPGPTGAVPTTQSGFGFDTPHPNGHIGGGADDNETSTANGEGSSTTQEGSDSAIGTPVIIASSAAGGAALLGAAVMGAKSLGFAIPGLGAGSPGFGFTPVSVTGAGGVAQREQYEEVTGDLFA